MIFSHQIRKILMTVGLVVILSTVITFGFASGKSWANPLLTSSISQPHALVATTNQAKVAAKKMEGKAQERIGNMTGDLKTQAAGKAKQFEANTQEAIIESIDNPNYQPNGKNLRKQNREAVKCLEDDVSNCFDQTQGPD
ncbi:CsbD family protein [Leptolyngbya sp. PCC 6406]|uniref:CsbD family protein n=1 Tax=Leptolyngbya sp. PCC 6406 TaxID=1173264 RepID=UPI0002ACBE04|nr:CsbD family protein [Leptolyngbya sp. PCC 6406]